MSNRKSSNGCEMFRSRNRSIGLANPWGSIDDDTLKEIERRFGDVVGRLSHSPPRTLPNWRSLCHRRTLEDVRWPTVYKLANNRRQLRRAGNTWSDYEKSFGFPLFVFFAPSKQQTRFKCRNNPSSAHTHTHTHKTLGKTQRSFNKITRPEKRRVFRL